MSTPVFVQTAITKGVNIATANPNRDGTGVVATLYTVPTAKQARIDGIKIKARVTTTAGMIRFWLHDGTTYYFLTEVPVAAITVSATAAAFERAISGLNLLLDTGWSIRCATEKAESFDIILTNAGEFS